jgi:tetratricopeptide (TPR) repeat protein
MTNAEKDVEFIERYLDDNLSPEEKRDFEMRLAVDEGFETVFKTYKSLVNGIKYSGRKELHQKLKQYEDSLAIEEGLQKRFLGLRFNSFYTYSVAASVLLLISFTYIFIINQRTSANDIYSDYFQPYPNVVNPTTRGGEQVRDIKEEAYRFYDMEEYEEAAIQFEKILILNQSDDILLYSANSYLALGKYDSAIAKLSILRELDSPFKTQSKWYLALSYLGKNDMGNAKKVLEELKGEKNSYSKKAENILKELD